jgi:ribosomal-protein-alanine N-acetyltransferase
MSNEGAQRLYQRFGFAPVGLRKDYYRDEDALVMWANDINGIDYQARLMNVRDDLLAAGYV